MSEASESETSAAEVGARLNQLLAKAGLSPVESSTAKRFGDYCLLLMRWNARTNLTAIRDREGILSRHFVESIACAQSLSGEIATMLDFGSGAGFPGVPIALCRPEIQVTLAESQGKKAAFLREAVRILGLSTVVHGGRAEALPTQFDWVVLRAVDRMANAVLQASALVRVGGSLAVMTTLPEWADCTESLGAQFTWDQPVTLPSSESRILAIGRKQATVL